VMDPASANVSMSIGTSRPRRIDEPGTRGTDAATTAVAPRRPSC
jgi:hypothetical protein